MNPSQEDYQHSAAALVAELKFVHEALRDMKDEVITLRNEVVDLKVKVSNHAVIFGLIGGGLSSGGAWAIQKLFHG